MNKIKNRLLKTSAAIAVAAAAVLGVPQAAQAATISTWALSQDSAAKVTGSVNFNNPWSYSSGTWTTQDLRADGKAPVLTVWAYGKNPSGGTKLLKYATYYGSPYAFSHYYTFYNSGGSERLMNVQIRLCNGSITTACTYRLLDNPYT